MAMSAGTENPTRGENPRPRLGAGVPNASLGEGVGARPEPSLPPCLERKVACMVFHQAKPALKVYTLRKRKEIFNWINELSQILLRPGPFAPNAKPKQPDAWQ